MFGGHVARVFNDGLTPIAGAASALTTDLVHGPQGADHQLTTTSTGRTGWRLYLDRQRTVRATAGADGVTTSASASAYTDFGVLESAASHLPLVTGRTPVGTRR